MLRDRLSVDISEFLRYLATHPEAENGLPSLNKLSTDLGISLAALREQLEVARALGLVEVRPRTGTRRLSFSFTPAVKQSLRYALALDDGHFNKFADLRNHIETAYWNEAVGKLTAALSVAPPEHALLFDAAPQNCCSLKSSQYVSVPDGETAVGIWKNPPEASAGLSSVGLVKHCARASS